MSTIELSIPTPLVALGRDRSITLLGITIDMVAVRAVLLAFGATRLLIFLIVMVSSTSIPMRAGGFIYSDPSNLLLDGLVRDDSWWYTNIATRGYSMGSVQTGAQGNAAFFPLYPLLAKLVAGLTGNIYLAGILVSNVALLLALGYLYALTRHEFDRETAARAVFYLAAAPTAIFFSAMYTESVYIALVAATFYYARQGKWVGAALAGALAAATRNTGVLLAAVVALEGMHQSGVRFRPPMRDPAVILAFAWQQVRVLLPGWRSLAAAACVPLGLLAYMAYLSNTFGDPLGFIHVQATWGREVSAGAGFTKLVGNVISQLRIGNFWAGQFDPKTLLDLLSTLAFLPLAIMVCRKMRPAYGVFVLLTLLVPLSTGTVGSMTRYILMLVPCFMLLAAWGRHSWVDRLVLGIFLPLMAYFAVLFSHWYFAG